MPGPVGDPPRVDLADSRVPGDRDRRVELARDVEGAHEVGARAAREDGDLDLVAGSHPEEAVDRLVHGAVAAHDDQALRAHPRRTLREPRDSTGAVAEERLAL